MASVVFLRGANVGGHRKFGPAALAKQMSDFGVVNIGAAGTFVVRSSLSAPAFRAALKERLPFETEILICPAREVLELVQGDPFAHSPGGKDLRQLVTVLAKKPNAVPKLPIRFPEGKTWQVEFFAISGRFALTIWRPDRKRLIYPNAVVEKAFGLPGTTRSWNTIEAAFQILKTA